MLLNESKKFELFLKWMIGILILFNLILVGFAQTIHPKVVNINLNKQIIASQQRQILLTFNHNMDRKSVETNFQIEPKIEGKFSWNGRTFAFTPHSIFPYGTKFKLKIAQTAQNQDGVAMGKEYVYSFETVPLKFAYIGHEGAEANRLVISNIDGTNRQIFTDGTLKLHNYQITPDGQGIYFLASTEKFFNEDRNELYFLDIKSKKITQITKDKKYLNKDFVLSPDGKMLILSRIELAEDGQLLTRIEAWITKVSDYKFEKFENGRATGTSIVFTPDSQYLLYRNTDSNFELSPIDSSEKEEPMFIGEYSDLYGIHPYRPLIAFTRYDETDVFALNNFLTLYSGDGERKDVPFEQGIARDTIFTKDGKSLITIFSRLDEQFDDQESFYPLRIFHLYHYDLESGKLEQLTDEMDYSEEWPAISPDSRYLLFLRYPTFSGNVVIDPAYREVSASLGTTDQSGELWMMDLASKELRNLNIKGSHLTFFP